MALSIKDEDTDKLARMLAEETGESLTQAVRRALRERLERVRVRGKKSNLADELDALALECASLPVLDRRSPEEILDYDERGLPR